MIEMRNAAVLPVPVWARPMASLAAQGEAQYLRLDRRAVGEAEVMDGVHQARGEVEVVEAGLAFLRFDHEVFQLPVVHRLRLAFAARLGVPAFFGGGFGGLFAFLGLFNGARGAGLVVGARGARFAWAFLGRLFAGGGGTFRGSAGRALRDRGGTALRLGSVGLAEDFLECFEHGDLVVVKE